MSKEIIDYLLKELAQKRAQIVSKELTTLEEAELDRLEAETAQKVYDIDPEQAESMWVDYKFQ